MDLANRPPDEPLLTTADLAAMEHFTLGGVIVSPSTRALRGPIGSIDVEPRVMQVLIVLAAAAGQVVTRETLFNRCWGGVYVGDDSLNRAVAALRRAVATVGGRFEVETIPRTGYLLTVPNGDGGAEAQHPIDRQGAHLSRRGALIAGSAVAALGATAVWWTARSRSDAQFNALMEHNRAALRNGSAFVGGKSLKSFQRAVALRPDNANAWGLLAVLKSILAQAADPKDVPRAVEEAQNAARKALVIDPKEPNALMAMFQLQGSSLDWATRDQRLRRIIAIDPKNLLAIGELILLLQAAGLSRESWNWNEHALTIEPLSQEFLGRRALKLWIAGRISEADKVIDHLRALYPGDPGPWWVRFLILALTGRPLAAQAMLDPDPARLGSPQEVEVWRTALAALEEPSLERMARAREACFRGARMAGELATQGVMILSALGQVDAAFDIANGFLLSRGSVVRRGETPFKPEVNDAGWRINTQWLFTPPAAVMRADPRFLPLCEGMGLGDYWRARGVRPDYMLAKR